MAPPEIPGYYYDEEKRKYFKVIKGGLQSSKQDKYHHNSIQSQKRRQEYATGTQKHSKKQTSAKENDRVGQLKLLDHFNCQKRLFSPTSDGFVNLKLGYYNFHQCYQYVTDFVKDKVLVPDTYVASNWEVLDICKVNEKEFCLESCKLSQINALVKFRLQSEKQVVSLQNSPLERHVSLLQMNFQFEFLPGLTETSSNTNDLVVFNTHAIKCGSTINNYFVLQKFHRGKVYDYTEDLLKFLSLQYTTPEDQDKLTALVSLCMVILPKEKPPLNLDNINKIIQECGPNDFRVRQFLADYLHPSKGYSYKTGFSVNSNNTYIIKCLLTENEIILLGSTSELIRITYNRANMKFTSLYYTKLPFKGKFVSLISDLDHIHVLIDNKIIIFTKDLKSHVSLPTSEMVKQAFSILKKKYVLVTRDKVLSLTNTSKDKFEKHFPRSRNTTNLVEKLEICNYFNDNDPFQLYYVFNNHLLINESVNEFKIINFKRAENNTSTFKLQLPFDNKNYRLKRIFKTNDFPLHLAFFYVSKLDGINYLVKFSI